MEREILLRLAFIEIVEIDLLDLDDARHPDADTKTDQQTGQFVSVDQDEAQMPGLRRLVPCCFRKARRSYGGIWVTRRDQAARLWVASDCATPSLNLTPS
ncbi:hypothetical protein, partial [Acidiphilium sp. 20-67-58]|uniref:hypothetical protein n=1 Tax=Acidiphilium sp. 20-67-58 TaxID=1970291 RepID=UPI0025C5F9F9